MRYAVAGSPAVEHLGEELLVCDPAGQTVHRLSGEGRRRFELILDGGLVEAPDDQVTAALEAAGLIVAVGDPTTNVVGMSRRRVLAVGAAAAAAGVVTVALPSAAAAESEGPGPSTTTTTAPPSGPSSFDVGYSLVGVNNSLGVSWLQGDYPEPFSYAYSVTIDGTPFTSGEATSTSNAGTFVSLGDLGSGGGRLVRIDFVSSTTPSTSTFRQFFTV